MLTVFPNIQDQTYQIEAEIGSGGGGVVYKAWHTRLQKHVIIKELKSGTALDIETQRNEVEALKNVKSAYLPQVYDFLTEGSRVFTVMEFVEGESLDKLLGRGEKFTQPQVVKWYGQLAAALETIHKQNVCHRDVKPANIMLTPGGDVCLIDFNAALVGGNDVRLISRSLGYASPEQYEIYERHKNTRRATSGNGNSGLVAKPVDISETESFYEDSGTELLSDDGGTEFISADSETELLTDDVKTEYSSDENKAVILGDGGQTKSLFDEVKTSSLHDGDGDFRYAEFSPDRSVLQRKETIAPPSTDGIDWMRSDIFSLGATMYHLLSGKRPPQRVAEVVAISKLGRFSEGIVYIVEQSMRCNPAERFASASILADAVRNIHKHDARWKVSQSKKIAAAVVLPLVFALFAATAIFGNNVMAQEKEERYYAAVYDIENGADPQSAYESALDMFWDRIDPYIAMAKRLWNDGDIDACMTFIEQNIGNIAVFRSVPKAQASYGEIYYILGNCYYQSDEPDYNKAIGFFEIAASNMTKNPSFYRDYAISLARTGNVAEAEQILEIARSLGLEADSLNLLQGEVSFAKKEYDRAIDYFGRVISLTIDDYMLYRALLRLDEIYKLLGQPERSVELLEGTFSRLSLNRVQEMTVRLANAYDLSGDYGNAIRLFEQLSSNGILEFSLIQRFAALLHTAGEFERAASVLEQMSVFFPYDYRVPMRQAKLEADRQLKIENDSRNYALAKQYYDEAVRMYGENVRPGESDPEMQELGLLIEQLREGGWKLD